MTVLPQTAQKLTIYITPIHGSIFLDKEGTVVALTANDVSLEPWEGIWKSAQKVISQKYKCGFCDSDVGSDQGFNAVNKRGSGNRTIACIRICPVCDGPTLFTPDGRQFPVSRPGSAVEHVPTDLYELYNEARAAVTAGAHTAAMMVCRKMLMNIAHDQGAKKADLESYQKSVNYLVENHFVPPGGEGWVDYVRRRGNEANHEIDLMEYEDARALVKFVEALLRFNYELIGMVPSDEDAEENAID